MSGKEAVDWALAIMLVCAGAGFFGMAVAMVLDTWQRSRGGDR